MFHFGLPGTCLYLSPEDTLSGAGEARARHMMPTWIYCLWALFNILCSNIVICSMKTLGDISWGPQPSFNSQLFIIELVDVLLICSSNLLKCRPWGTPKSMQID